MWVFSRWEGGWKGVAVCSECSLQAMRMLNLGFYVWGRDADEAFRPVLDYSADDAV